MSDLVKVTLQEYMSKDVCRADFYCHMAGNRRDTDELVSEVKEVIAKHHLSASQTKGFLEYMKFIVDGSSYLPHKE